ncbi:hypothetical protein C2845_PM14G19470 [Panicum miliaceum]|uniref:Uncharacterized protein n=1 Tax=Panicum miliaceum TaxID=4540 RepID=A0A3L6PQU6_PANMI|nr:hypothetical protein C2845_PM14G19470 [Panicum miliaceum]
MAETLLLPVVRGVLGKAADALVQKVTAMWGVDDDRRDLELKLLYVQSLLADAEAKAEAESEAGHTMRQLTHIYLRGCISLEQMPPKLSLLHNLCTLTSFIVDTGDGFGIEELQCLRQLGNMLELFNLRKVKSGSKANLHEKKNLTELFLHWGRKVGYNPLHDEVVSNNQEEVLESLVPNTKLKTLELHGYGGLAISQWMRDPQMFCCLRELRIFNCPRCKDLPLVWLLSPLEKLHLSSMNSLTTLCKNIDAEAAGYSTSQEIFPKLKMMWLDELPEFERWAENSAGEPNSLVMFPQLEELLITNCNRIVNLPEAPALSSASFFGGVCRLYCFYEHGVGIFSISYPLEVWEAGKRGDACEGPSKPKPKTSTHP